MSKSTAGFDMDHRKTPLDSAGRNDEDAFQRLAEPYRREIQLHCYRMLGSLQDAEDLVQETFLRAWRGLDGFEGRSSLRSWLYRIATNACLNALAKRTSARRTLPEAYGPPTTEMPEGAPLTELAWIEPYPDALIEGIADTAPSPDARYEMRETVQLAFVAAIQHLPPRQRAVLLLRDVLGWSAAETAGLLDTSVASANSALQRARTTVEKQFPTGRPAILPPPDDQQLALLDRYVRAWENTDIEAFVALLRDDAVLNMPPWPHWYRGREAIRTFFTWAWQQNERGTLRPRQARVLVPTSANGQTAFATYRYTSDEKLWRANAIYLLTLQGDAIASITSFVPPVGPRLFAAFGLSDVLPSEDVAWRGAQAPSGDQ